MNGWCIFMCPCYLSYTLFSPFQVLVTLTKQVEKQSFPLYRLTVLKLGSEGRIKMHDMTLTAYLKKVQMNCLEFTGKSYLMEGFSQMNVTQITYRFLEDNVKLQITFF